DLLLQVLLHAEMAAERGEFDIRAVMDGVREKMVRRHPHVFAGLAVAGTEEVLGNWSRIKAEERRAKQEDASVLAGVPTSLPALLRAERLAEKAARVGFDWPSARSVLDKVHEELMELRAALEEERIAEVESEVGDCLFALASLARKSGVSAELALR